MELSAANFFLSFFLSPSSSKLGCFGSIPQSHTPTPMGLGLVPGAESGLVQRVHYQTARANHKGGVCNAPAFQCADQTGGLHHKVALGSLGGLPGTPQVHGNTRINLDLNISDWRWWLGELKIVLFLVFQRDKVGPRSIDSSRNRAGDGIALGQRLGRRNLFLETKASTSGRHLAAFVFCWMRWHIFVLWHEVCLINSGCNSVRDTVALWQRLRANDVVLGNKMCVGIGIDSRFRLLLSLLE